VALYLFTHTAWLSIGEIKGDFYIFIPSSMRNQKCVKAIHSNASPGIIHHNTIVHITYPIIWKKSEKAFRGKLRVRKGENSFNVSRLFDEDINLYFLYIFPYL
jgi:hypothetical protein